MIKKQDTICPKCNRGKIYLNEHEEYICEVCGIVSYADIPFLERGKIKQRKK